jgi:twitching motility protein PilT
MIEKILNLSVEKRSHQLSFVLGQKILSKTGFDWSEVSNTVLKINEWEDLKDLSLQGNEKIQLETKGFVSGIYQSKDYVWKFSFIEQKDCFRAFFSIVNPKLETDSQIQNPLFWDLLKKDTGLFIFAGPRRSGKSSLIAEVVNKMKNEKVTLTGIHSPENEVTWPEVENLVHLGNDSLDWELNHPVYDGLERIVVDCNSIHNLEKWIQMCEQGRSIFLTLTAETVQITLQQILEKLTPGLTQRFFNKLNGIAVQKLSGPSRIPIHELFLNNGSESEQIRHLAQQFKIDGGLDVKSFSNKTYQSLNQSIIQNLIRRQLDVKTAFSSSNDPEELDQLLKRMGL